jgi:hypothetical protein
VRRIVALLSRGSEVPLLPPLGPAPWERSCEGVGVFSAGRLSARFSAVWDGVGPIGAAHGVCHMLLHLIVLTRACSTRLFCRPVIWEHW